jgi:hypothetical protein
MRGVESVSITDTTRVRTSSAPPASQRITRTLAGLVDRLESAAEATRVRTGRRSRARHQGPAPSALDLPAGSERSRRSKRWRQLAPDPSSRVGTPACGRVRNRQSARASVTNTPTPAIYCIWTTKKSSVASRAWPSVVTRSDRGRTLPRWRGSAWEYHAHRHRRLLASRKMWSWLPDERAREPSGPVSVSRHPVVSGPAVFDIRSGLVRQNGAGGRSHTFRANVVGRLHVSGIAGPRPGHPAYERQGRGLYPKSALREVGVCPAVLHVSRLARGVLPSWLEHYNCSRAPRRPRRVSADPQRLARRGTTNCFRHSYARRRRGLTGTGEGTLIPAAMSAASASWPPCSSE